MDRLKAILLIEGDYNFFFGHVAVNKMYEIGYNPEDLYRRKSSTAEDSKLDNRLTIDVSGQF